MYAVTCFFHTLSQSFNETKLKGEVDNVVDKSLQSLAQIQEGNFELNFLQERFYLNSQQKLHTQKKRKKNGGLKTNL